MSFSPARSRMATGGLAVAAASALLAAGCRDDGAGPPPPPAAAGTRAAPSTPAGTTGAASTPSLGRSAAGGPTTADQGGPAVSPSYRSEERPGDLVRGVRTLTGIVERTSQCVILRVDDSTWALLGASATTLAAGRTVEVTGTVATPPAGCTARQALTVTRVR